MNVSPTDQRQLLEVAALDARIQQAEQARTNPPQASRVKELIARRQQLTQELSQLLGTRDDVQTELKRIEADVAVVDARRARDEQRLATSSNSKEAQGLESEIAALARRKNELEDGQLEVMERLEQAEAAIAAHEAQVAENNDEGSALSAEAKQVVAAATESIESATSERAAIVAALPEPFVAQYHKIAERGVGAALLRRGTCEGCTMVLAGTDLNTIRNASEDAVLTCPECGCILVRTDESGL